MPQLISAANSLADTCYQTDSHSSQSFTQMHGKTHPMPNAYAKDCFCFSPSPCSNTVTGTPYTVFRSQSAYFCFSPSPCSNTVTGTPYTVFRSQSAYFGKTTPVLIRKLQALTTQCGNSISFSLTASGNSLHSPHYHHTTPTPNSSTSSSLKVPGRWQHSA